MNKCKFCDFHQEPNEWEIGLYVETSYKYIGKRYFLEVEYPLGDLRKYPQIKRVEINFCPMCGKWLSKSLEG